MVNLNDFIKNTKLNSTNYKQYEISSLSQQEILKLIRISSVSTSVSVFCSVYSKLDDDNMKFDERFNNDSFNESGNIEIFNENDRFNESVSGNWNIDNENGTNYKLINKNENEINIGEINENNEFINNEFLNNINSENNKFIKNCTENINTQFNLQSDTFSNLQSNTHSNKHNKQHISTSHLNIHSNKHNKQTSKHNKQTFKIQLLKTLRNKLITTKNPQIYNLLKQTILDLPLQTVNYLFKYNNISCMLLSEYYLYNKVFKYCESVYFFVPFYLYGILPVKYLNECDFIDGDECGDNEFIFGDMKSECDLIDVGENECGDECNMIYGDECGDNEFIFGDMKSECDLIDGDNECRFNEVSRLKDNENNLIDGNNECDMIECGDECGDECNMIYGGNKNNLIERENEKNSIDEINKLKNNINKLKDKEWFLGMFPEFIENDKDIQMYLKLFNLNNLSCENNKTSFNKDKIHILNIKDDTLQIAFNFNFISDINNYNNINIINLNSDNLNNNLNNDKLFNNFIKNNFNSDNLIKSNSNNNNLNKNNSNYNNLNKNNSNSININNYNNII
ncbi:hypothetical protein NAPIS_ORF02718 [Vairimorpha apis BRL 01]|uniref:Uncharacterized protein n=1 Tax=Vairimorpha apis BRL 01 TaxID=1037528 RepID=T0M8I7_9MICR|nr:hypothetical protein NAPIS_ORF02718 [Vairimorpha apis BRL 01]